jgi:hypothetical protein
MRLPGASFILVGAILGACTTVQNTPQQDLVWSAYNRCKAEGRIPNNLQVVRVEPDGRAWYSAYSSAYGSQALERCVTEKISSSSGAAPPTPRDIPALSP